MVRLLATLVTTATFGISFAASDQARDYRASVIARAQIWQPTNVAAIDFTKGPEGAKGPAVGETITCTHVKKKLSGHTPKFACRTDDEHDLKVKYGGDNGEVYAEVLGTRLLWALGFGADRMYSVRIVCHDCPDQLNGAILGEHDRVFDPAAIEHKFAGAEFEPDPGWSWSELDLVSEAAGGATRAQIDALKLLAVFMQHTDSKPEQQRLACLDETKHDAAAGAKSKASKAPMPCEKPFMLINDLGVTFGRANRTNKAKPGSVNLVEWSKTPVWKDGTSCVGNLPKSATGTLDNPLISEEGRKFLADLLTQLSDAQLHDLFASARVTLRVRDPRDVKSGFPTIDDWVDAFKQKRSQIVNHTCATT